MAQIKISGRKETIQIPNEKANIIKAKMEMMRKGEDEMIDIGTWFGFISQIKSIELEYERKAPAEDYNRPLTKEEQKNAAKQMALIRKNLEAKGMLKSKQIGKNQPRCEECRCLIERKYICRHECPKCADYNPF